MRRAPCSLTDRFCNLVCVLLLTLTYSIGLNAGERPAGGAHGRDNKPQPGLIAWFCEGRQFDEKNILLERIDGTVNFAWGGDAPAPEVPGEEFCARWSGSLKIRKPGRYTLATITDDGVRLTIDGKPLTDQWTDMGDTRVAGELDLTEGEHRIQLDFYQGLGGSTCKLLWAKSHSAGKKDGWDETIIPVDALSHLPSELKHPPKRAPQPEDLHPDFPPGYLPADWTALKSADPKAAAKMTLDWRKSWRREDRTTFGPRFLLRTAVSRFHVLKKKTSPDGTDDAPLITTVGIQQTEQWSTAFRLAYCWDARNFVAIGMNGRYQSAVTIVHEGRRLYDPGFGNYALDAYFRPAYFRLVLTHDTIQVQVSSQRDFNYRTVAVIHNRRKGMAGPPTTVMGFGTVPWETDYGQPFLANDYPNADMNEEATEILYFDQRTGMGVRPGRIPEIGEAADWDEAEAQLSAREQPQQWNFALLGNLQRAFWAPTALEAAPQLTKEVVAKFHLPFESVDLKDNGEPYNFNLHALFKSKDLRKTAAIAETTIPHGDDPFVRVFFGVREQASISIGQSEIAWRLSPNYYQTYPDRFAAVGRIDPHDGGQLRFKIWNNDRDMRMWARVEPNFPGSRIGELQALSKRFTGENERPQRIGAHLEIGALGMQFYNYSLARSGYSAALAEALQAPISAPSRQAAIDHCRLALLNLAELLGDTAATEEQAAAILRDRPEGYLRLRAWSARANARLYSQGATAAAAELEKAAQAEKNPELRRDIFRLAARGYVNAGDFAGAAAELEKAGKLIDDHYAVELRLTALQYRLNLSLNTGAKPDDAVKPLLGDLRKILADEVNAATQTPKQPEWSKYWQDRAAELEAKQPSRAWSALQSAVFEQLLWRRADPAAAQVIFAGHPFDYGAAVDIPGDKFTLDRNKLWDACASEMVPGKWELHPPDPLVLDPLDHTYDAEKGAGPWNPVKLQWFNMVNIERNEVEGVYHARTTLTIPAQPVPDQQVWLSLNAPGKIWIDGKLVFQQTRVVKSQFDMLALPATAFKPGEHQVMVKLIRYRKDQRARVSVRLSTMSAFRVALQHYEANAAFASSRDFNSFLDRLEDLTGGWSEFLPYDCLAQISCARAQLAGGNLDYAVDRALGQADAAMKARESDGAAQLLQDVAWRLALLPAVRHHSDSVYALLERWRNLGLDTYDLAMLENARSFGETTDVYGRGGAFSQGLAAETQALRGNLEQAQQIIRGLRAEYADFDIALQTASAVETRLGRRERAQRDFQVSDEATADIEDAQRMIEQEEYKRALQRLLKTAAEHGNLLFRVEGGRAAPDGRLVSVHTFVDGLLRDMPKPLWPVYVGIYDQRSLSALAAARQAGDREHYLAVAEEFPYTPGSLAALNIAAALATDADQPADAIRHYQRLLLETATRLNGGLQPAPGAPDPALVRYKLALLLQAQNRGAEARQLLANPVDETIQYRGRPTSLKQLMADLTAGAQAPAADHGPAGWRSLRGDLAQSGRVNAPWPATSPTLAWVGELPWLAEQDAAAANLIPAPYYAGLQTAAVGSGRVITSGDAGCTVRDLNTGRRLWAQAWNSQLLDLQEQGRRIDFTGLPIHAPDVVGNYVAARVVVDGQGAFEAHDLASGRLLLSTRYIRELKNYHAFGAPLLCEGLLIGRFLSMRDSGALTVAAIDLGTGRLAWNQPLVTGTAAIAFNDVTIPLAIQLPPPAYQDGAIIFDTGLGAIAAVDVRTGAPRWVTHFDRAKVVALDDRALFRSERCMMTPFIGSPCLIDHKVIVRPRDRAELLALDADTGKILWRLADDPGWYLIGADNERIYTYDGRLKALRPADGATLWQTDLPAGSLRGRGFLCNDGLVLPTAAGWTLFDAAEGRAVRTLPLPPGQTDGHLVPLVEHGQLTRVLQVDSNALRAWSFTAPTAQTAPADLESALVQAWNRDWRGAIHGDDDDEEDEAGGEIPAAQPAAASDLRPAWLDRLTAALPTAPTARQGFLRRDPDDELLHVGTQWALQPDLLAVGPAGANLPLADFAAPLPPDSPTAAISPLLTITGGNARVLRDPNTATRAYVYAGGVLTALDLAGARPAILWRRVVTGSLTGFAVNEDRLACCSYTTVSVFDARNGLPILTRNLGQTGNWNLRTEWITDVAVGRDQVAVFLSTQVGFRAWYDGNARNKTVEVYNLADGAWRWRRTLSGSYNHFEQPQIHGNRLYAFESPEYHSQVGWFWSFDLAQGTALTHTQRPPNRDCQIFDDPTGRGYFLFHNGDLIWFDPAKGDLGWTTRQDLLSWDNACPVAATDNAVTLLGSTNNDKTFRVDVLDRRTGKRIVEWKNEIGVLPDGANEYYTFGGVPNTYDLKLTRRDLADPAKAVCEQVWPGMHYVRPTPYGYVTGDSVVVFAYARMYNVESWYEALVFSRQSGTLLHREMLSLVPVYDRWNHPQAQVLRFGRNYLLCGRDGAMVVGPLTAEPVAPAGAPQPPQTAPPVDVTLMHPLLARDAAAAPLNANRYRAAITTEIPPICMALRFGGRAAVIDGNLAEWQGFDPWELKAPDAYHAFLNRPLTHPDKHSASVRTAWDRDGIYLAVEVRDPSRQPAPPNADYRLGDSVRVTLLGDNVRTGFVRDNIGWIDLAVTGTGADAHLELFNGDPRDGIQYAAMARPDLGAGGRTLELFLPWTALDVNLNEWREDRMIRLLCDVAVCDADEGRPAQGQLEFGAGLTAGALQVEPQRFGEIHLIDLSKERMLQMQAVLDLIPDDPKAWDIMNLLESSMRGAVGLRRRIDMFESFVKKHPASPVSLRAIPHLAYLYGQTGVADPTPQALKFAQAAKVPGDKLAAAMKAGFHFKLWLNPENPPSQVMIQFNTRNGGWCRRGSWGSLFIGWGQRDTVENMLLGPLPAPGKWTDMFIPAASQGLEGETIVGVAFSYRGGDARFDAAEYTDGADRSLVYLDDSDEGYQFRNTPISWDAANKASGKQSFYGNTKEFISNLSVEPKKWDERNFTFAFNSTATTDPSPAQLEAWFQAAHLLGDHPMGWEFFNRVITCLTDKKAKAGLTEAYTRYVTDNPDSPFAAQALRKYYELTKNQFNVDDDFNGVEKLMKDAKVTTAVRRAFYRDSFPGLSALDLLGPLEGGPTAGADVIFDPEKNLDFKAHLQGRQLEDPKEAAPPPAADPDHPTPPADDADLDPKFRDITWQALDLRNHKDWKHYPDAFNFRAIWPEKNGQLLYNRVGFAHFTVASKSALPAYLYLGAERVVTVYVNNKQIVKNLSSHGTKDHNVIPLRLIAGDNHVLIKFGNNEAELNLRVRLADRYGKPIPGLTFGTALPVPKPAP